MTLAQNMTEQQFRRQIREKEGYTMTDEKLGALFEAFAHYYWSVPVAFTIRKITEWHPDVTARQVEEVLRQCNEGILRFHFFWETEGLEEPEIVTEHLLAFGREDFEKFLSARIDGPICECDEETLLDWKEERLDIPEINAIMDFGREEMDLDDDWAKQLADDCLFSQSNALCEGESWVMDLLFSELYGKIYFRTVEQVKRIRDLGNQLYLAVPNPVLKCWKPTEIANPPMLLDDIPEKDEDIPDGRPAMDAIFDRYGGREEVSRLFKQRLSESGPRKKVGRNDPCPCGSGKKYKKCCGKNV